MEFQAIVFEPGKEGEIKKMTTSDFSTIVGGSYERTYNKHGKSDTTVIVNEEGVLMELPRNRGYHGTFIIVKEPESDESEGYDSFSQEEAKAIKKVLDKKGNYESKNTFLKTFFEEKNVPVTTFQYEKGIHFITLSNYDVIESLLASSDKNFLSQVEEMLRKIDFLNGDVNHFLQHMGNGMAEQIAQSQDNFFNF
ncbi:hypothetical protein CVD28_01280 [Bacillus sp. M6-12]|uniref:DUF3846 domain-containing protein n=1 Tax=Bacillus sp. M6-12 TaxID=2054166 RepID=UPI000C755CC2|nr:hypothetical protein [Bacillus sp. M6-12]PLS19066.1 hypothetical protein CVD28_01280 [Bacillus sp. M6-12]